MLKKIVYSGAVICATFILAFAINSRVQAQASPSPTPTPTQSQPSITVITPAGGDVYKVGETHNITWRANGVQTVNISLNAGASGFITIASNIPASNGSYQWTIPDNAFLSPFDAVVVNSSSNASIGNYSQEFTIVSASGNGQTSNPTPSPTPVYSPATSPTCIPGFIQTSNGCIPSSPNLVLKVVAPNGGESLVAGQTYRIKWTGGKSAVDISLLDNPTRLGTEIFSGIPNNGYVDWTVAPLTSITDKSGRVERPSGQYVIFVSCSDDDCTVDDSDAPFTIVGSSVTPSPSPTYSPAYSPLPTPTPLPPPAFVCPSGYICTRTNMSGAPLPTISYIYPTSVSTEGGDVTVYGANFDQNSSVILGGPVGTSPITIYPDKAVTAPATTLSFMVPSGLSVSIYTVQIQESPEIRGNAVNLTVTSANTNFVCPAGYICTPINSAPVTPANNTWPTTQTNSISSQNPGAGLALASGAQLSFQYLANSNVDHAGIWGVFSTDGTPDWNWQGTLTLNSAKTIQSMLLTTDQYGDADFTSAAHVDGVEMYPLVVFYNGQQLDTAYNQQLGTYQPGTYTFNFYGQKAYPSSFNTFTMTVYFTDGTYVTSSTPGNGSGQVSTNCQAGYDWNGSSCVIQTTAQTSITVLSPSAGQSYTLGKDSIHVSWTPTLPGVSTIQLVSTTNNSNRMQLYGQLVNGDPTNTNGSYTYQLPNNLLVQPGSYYINLIAADGGPAVRSAIFSILSPVATTPPVIGSYTITSISGQQTSYSPGNPITIQVQTSQPDGTPASQSAGFNVQAGLYDPSLSAKSYLQNVNGNFNSSTGLWTAQLIAPSGTNVTTYAVDVALYCSYIGLDSQCGQKYGINGQQTKTFQFNVTSSSQSSGTNQTSSNSNGNQTLTDAVTQLYTTLLYRQPDAAGLSYWVNSGLGIDTIKQDFLNGNEYYYKQEIVKTFKSQSYTPSDQNIDDAYTKLVQDSYNLSSLKQIIQSTIPAEDHAANLTSAIMEAIDQYNAAHQQ